MKPSPSKTWGRFFSLLALEKKDILQIFYYAIFAGALALNLPSGIQAIVNLIQGTQISSSWIIITPFNFLLLKPPNRANVYT